MNLSEITSFSDTFLQAYTQMCKPLCRELQFSQTAFDILMFLANNPQYQTAADIVRVRRIKPNLVSFHVDRLVEEGYLERRFPREDRRKILLACTPKAGAVIERGRNIQRRFFQAVTAGVSEEELRGCMEIIRRIGGNAEKLTKK